MKVVIFDATGMGGPSNRRIRRHPSRGANGTGMTDGAVGVEGAREVTFDLPFHF
jgi:hypothetical protein